MWAARYDSASTVEVLVDRGAKIEAVDDEGLTALMWVARGGVNSTLQLLLDNGASINGMTLKHRTPLHLAAEAGNYEMTKVFLELSPGSRYVKDAYSQTPGDLAFASWQCGARATRATGVRTRPLQVPPCWQAQRSWVVLARRA